MRYTPVRKDDFDKSFKYKKQSFLCYSEKKLKELLPEKDYKIVGFARYSDKDTGDRLVLGQNIMPVFDPEKDNPIYRSIGYIPVDEEKSFIAVQKSRIPFAAGLGGMAAATAIICLLIVNTTPKTAPQQEGTDPSVEGVPEFHQELEGFLINEHEHERMFNPLPPVDTNIEEYKDTVEEKKPAEEEEAPKGGGKVTISYKPDAKLDLSTGEVTMEYLNPENSSHDAVLNLYAVSGDQEYLIATSGRIPAGSRLKTMQLTADKSLFGGEGRYDAKYGVVYYDPDTGERALAEANIEDIKLIVLNG